MLTKMTYSWCKVELKCWMLTLPQSFSVALSKYWKVLIKIDQKEINETCATFISAASYKCCKNLEQVQLPVVLLHRIISATQLARTENAVVTHKH